MWLRSYNDLNEGTTYAEHPVENSPEFIPLDNSLNADIKSSLLHHCAVIAQLKNDDIRKYSLSTPAITSRSLLRIWNHPDGRRRVQE